MRGYDQSPCFSRRYSLGEWLVTARKARVKAL
jgi:hypothetical protein